MEQFKGKSRLPKFAVPTRYDIQLKPDLVACTFSGTVSIHVDVVSDTRFLVFNAAELSVVSGSVSFYDPNSSTIFKPSEIGFFEEDEIWVLEFADTLPLRVGVLAIGFDGILNDNLKGFYRSTYEYDGEVKNMAVTQFEAADARRCFPCWDEPVFKAKFKMTLDVPSDLVALSNMPVIEEQIDGNFKTVSYQESPMMSTYLVAIVVGLFDYVEDHTSDGTRVRIYSQVGKTAQGKFSLEVGVKSLEFYKEYFGVPYALPKLDMIAIPDFAAGAMENYGLVTFRETEILYDDENSSASNKQNVAITVAHELAHQWFGNLVTMEWWTDIWLNEGFATWMSYLANDSLFPEWKLWNQFLDESSTGLRLDGLEGSHPIEVEINHASEIDEIFDDITYSKGACIIRMIQSYLGAQSFQRSLASYIKRHSFGNAKTEDLWDSLEEGSGEPVKEIMNTWTKQQGYPVVSVKVRDKSLEFEQSQFLYTGAHSDRLWTVPITFCCGSYDVSESFLLKTKSKTHDVTTSSWVKVNVHQAGFYRVKYDEKLAAELRSAIEKNYLSTTDRYGILDDAYALCTASQESFVSLITLMVAYKEELEYSVLTYLITVSYKLVRIAADAVPGLLGLVKQFFINILLKSAERLGWQAKAGESDLDAILRGEVLTALAIFGHGMTLDEASRRFYAFLDDRNTTLFPPDIRKAAYVGVMQRVTASNRSDYESLLKLYRESDLSQEKIRILGSLATCPDSRIVLEVLNFLLSSEVRHQDVYIGLKVSLEGREVAWSWLQSNWDYIAETWGSGTLLALIVSSVVSQFASFEKLKEIEDFFIDHSIPSITRTVKQSIERVNINANWVQSVCNEKDIADALKDLSHGQVQNQTGLSWDSHCSDHVPFKLRLCFCFLSVIPVPNLDSVVSFFKNFSKK